MSTRYIAPLLRVGEAPDQPTDLGEAIILMTHDKVAVVPDDDVARQVLRYYGLPECCVEDRIHFSLTGEILCSGHEQRAPQH